jgi:chromosomal replication initiator protein
MLSPSTAQHYWTQALDHTRSRSPATFEQWFASVQFDGVEAGIVCLTARDEFVRDWVADHFLPTLKGRLEDLLGGELAVRWQVDKNLVAPVCPPPSLQRAALRRPLSSVPPAPSAPAVVVVPPPAGAFRQSPTDRDPFAPLPAAASFAAGSAVSGVSSAGEASAVAASASEQARMRRLSLLPGPSAALNAKFTFENFVVGPSNELAHAAAYASAGGGGPRYNPLFIAGGTGLGKTHLMHAIAHKVLGDRPAARIVYVSAEHFTNEFIEALQNHRMEEFRARYRSHCDVLLVDDIQFLAGREQTQEEFFHTFNALHDAGVPIIVTSDKYPQQLQRMPDRLVSRFTSGLVADVQAPQLETRVAILKKKAQLEQIVLPDAVAVLLAQKVHSNVRELEGSLIRLAAKASLTGRHIDESLMRSEMSLVTAPSQRLVCVADIQKAVCSHFRMTSADLLSKDRHKSVAFARQVAMYLCRQRLKSSFPELGRAFGNRDHTTVISAVKRVESLRKRDPQVNAHLEAIERRLASSDEN